MTATHTILEKAGRERISVFACGDPVLRFLREGPPLLGFSAHSKADRERWSGNDWRRECDWDPKASEFVATILLGRVRLGSNSDAGNTRESVSAVSDVSPALATGSSNLSPLLFRLCCKSRKFQGDEFFAKTRNRKRSLIHVTSITRGDEVPHVFTRKTRLQPAEFLIPSAKRVLQHNPSTSGHREHVAASPLRVILRPQRPESNSSVSGTIS